jgi:hypothetical protein|tara:strand:- start:830 stop:1069 length:240 start_codon:yes stop_codon:yes gene_type:complete
MAKAKSKVEKKVKDIEESILDITDCQCGEEIKRIDQIEEYLVTAKDLIVVHDEAIEKVEDSIKSLHAKIDRALSRLGIG